MRMKDPTARYLASLRLLDARIVAWEAMPADSLSSELERILDEVSVNGETGKSGGTLTFALACVRGQAAPNPETAALVKSLWHRQLRLQSKAREARFAAEVRADVGKRGGQGKQLKNADARAIAAAREQARAFWWSKAQPGGKGIGTQSGFAMEIMGKWPELKSHGVIVKWIREWTREENIKRRTGGYGN